MLVLSRHKGEVIYIGDRLIKVTVIEILGDRVRIGIDAPKDVSVNRAEVQNAIERGEVKP